MHRRRSVRDDPSETIRPQDPYVLYRPTRSQLGAELATSTAGSPARRHWSVALAFAIAIGAGACQGRPADTRLAQSPARAEESAPVDVMVESGVRSRMTDGVELVPDVYRPSRSGQYPVLLTRTPYNRRVEATVARPLDSHPGAASARWRLPRARGTVRARCDPSPSSCRGWAAPRCTTRSIAPAAPPPGRSREFEIVHVGFGARDGAAGVRMLDDASRSAKERPVAGNASTPSAGVYARVEQYSRRVSWDRSRRGREDVAPVGGARGAPGPGAVGKRTLTMDLPVAPSKAHRTTVR